MHSKYADRIANSDQTALICNKGQLEKISYKWFKGKLKDFVWNCMLTQAVPVFWIFFLKGCCIAKVWYKCYIEQSINWRTFYMHFRMKLNIWELFGLILFSCKLVKSCKISGYSICQGPALSSIFFYQRVF